MKKRLGLIIRVVISAGILLYLFNSIFQKETVKYFESQGIDPVELTWHERAVTVWTQGPLYLWDVISNGDMKWFFLGVFVLGIMNIFAVIRWRMILAVQGLNLSFPRANSIYYIGLFFNAFMLGSTGGDIVKAWYAAHETHHKKAEAVATVVVDRLIGLMSLFLIALIMMTIHHDRVFNDLALRTFAIVTLAIVMTTALVTFLGLWKGVADKLPKMRSLLQKIPYYGTLKRMIDAYRIYASHPLILGKTVLLSFGVHAGAMLSIVFIGKGLGIVTANGFIDYFLYLPIINSLIAIPISISGFGVRELLYEQMFGGVSVTQTAAVAMSLMGYLAMLTWSLVGSSFYLTHRKELPPQDELIKEN